MVSQRLILCVDLGPARPQGFFWHGTVNTASYGLNLGYMFGLPHHPVTVTNEGL